MHSIRTRITSLTIVAIFACAILIGTVSLFTVKAEEEESSEQLMTLLCTTKCDAINSYLGTIEQAADTIAQFAYESLDSVELSNGDVVGATGSGRSMRGRDRSQEQQQTLDAYLQTYLDNVEALSETIGENNASVLGYWYRINPELSSVAKGFWYSKHGSLVFQKQEPTDISSYRVDDYAHVGWYYEALERGRPSWLDPYVNKNLGSVEIVSYVIPVYKAGTFIGVVGIDISYESLVSEISDLEVLDTGYAFLTDAKGKTVYHPQFEYDVLLSSVNSEIEAAQAQEEGSKLIWYKYNGVRKCAAWGTLSNGLHLMVSAPVSEINASWRSLLWMIPVIALSIAGLSVWVATQFMRRITDPLEHLADAAEQLSAGNYDVELSYTGNDEIGTLTKAFQQMADHLRYFVNDLDFKAHRDALTKVRNKRAFDLFCFELNEKLAEGEEGLSEFAVVMFDCNDLKSINDSYGHGKGDLYLQNACRLICKVYEHSPVFRVGGDEFVAFLQGEYVSQGQELEERFDREAAAVSARSALAWDHVSVAHGRATYDPTADTRVEDVVNRADTRMYENKRDFKKTHGR